MTDPVSRHMYPNWLEDLSDRVIKGGDEVGPDEALHLLECADKDLPLLIRHADRIRRQFFKDTVNLCSIVNARSGLCHEDCAFCSQSAHHRSRIDTYPMMEPEKILDAARRAEQAGATEFSIVTSGKGMERGPDLDNLIDALGMIRRETGLNRCASVGVADREMILTLAEAGLQRFHHNLETSPSFYQKICSTRGFDENVQAVLEAKEAGLQVCCGGIFGMGETDEQRVELALFLSDLGVDSVPINFLDPIPGTRLQDRDTLRPGDGLRIIAMLRFVLPDRKIVICGGRERVLGDMQESVFHAGATGLLIGDYLTTKGRPAKEDLQLVRDSGLRPEGG